MSWALLLLVPFAAAPAAPTIADFAAAYGEQVGKDIEALKALKPTGPIDGGIQCLQSYMRAVDFEKAGNAGAAKQQFRACTAACKDRMPAATIQGARDIAQRYSDLCREKSGEKPPAPPAGDKPAATAPTTATTPAATPADPTAAPKRFKAAGACDAATTKGSCREFPNFKGFRKEKDEKQVCDSLGDRWVSGEGCPEANLLGSCTEKATKQVQRWYDAGGNKGLKTANVQDACDAMGGTYVAP